MHAPCSRSWRWRPTSIVMVIVITLCEETELHEEEAPHRHARRHGETAGGGGGAGATSEAGSTTTTTREGENSAAAASACHHHHHHDVPRQLVRQAGHRVPVKEPSRSFWYVLCAPAHVLIRSRHHWNDRKFLPSMTAIASFSGHEPSRQSFGRTIPCFMIPRESCSHVVSRALFPLQKYRDMFCFPCAKIQRHVFLL